MTLVDRDSSVGIATCYGLDGPMIESRKGRYFPHPSSPDQGPNQTPIQWGHTRGLSGRGVVLTNHLHLVPRLKKKYSYTSAHLLRLHVRL